MVNGIIGKKVGMTQLFLEDGTLEPATVLQAGPCVVVQAKTAQADGYEAVQIGLVEGKKYKANKATAGHYKKANVPPTRVRREVSGGQGRGSAGARRSGAGLRSSTRASASTSSAPARATASRAWSSATTSRGGDKSHGSMFHRAPGSIGASSYPSRVMPGHAHARPHGRGPRHGAQPEGAEGRRREQPAGGQGRVPGANGGYVVIRKAVAAKPEPQPQLQEKPKKGKK